jgi:hypothetical protein
MLIFSPVPPILTFDDGQQTYGIVLLKAQMFSFLMCSLNNLQFEGSTQMPCELSNVDLQGSLGFRSKEDANTVQHVTMSNTNIAVTFDLLHLTDLDLSV